MKIDGILSAILDWIALILKRRKQKKKPYEILNRKHSRKGHLYLIRRDTSSAVRSYIFMPKRQRHTCLMRDIHIYLDTLNALEKSRAKRRREVLGSNRVITYTHKITILWASHWPKVDGTYLYELIHTDCYDLQGQTKYENRMAIAVIDNLASLLLYREPDEVDWPLECELSRKQMLITRGMTLIELLVALVVTGALAAIVTPSLLRMPRKAKEAEGLHDLGQVVNAQKRHYLINGEFSEDLIEISEVDGGAYRVEVDVNGDRVGIKAVPDQPGLETFERSLSVCPDEVGLNIQDEECN